MIHRRPASWQRIAGVHIITDVADIVQVTCIISFTWGLWIADWFVPPCTAATQSGKHLPKKANELPPAGAVCPAIALCPHISPRTLAAQLLLQVLQQQSAARQLHGGDGPAAICDG